jgi:putative ABC transport system ATP-binding protein
MQKLSFFKEPTARSDQVIISLENISKHYRVGEIETTVLHNVNFSILRGDFAVILGPSGCGKTTLLNLIGGLDAPSHGRIHFNGQQIPYHNLQSLVLYRREHLGFIFQFYNLLPTLTALENVEIILDLTVQNKEEKRQRSLEYLQRLGMADKANKFPYQLSGGEQQRVAIARALVKQPSLVLADEPTGNLDEDRHSEIMQILLDMSRKERTTVVLVTHNTSIAELADRIVHINHGQLVENGR